MGQYGRPNLALAGLLVLCASEPNKCAKAANDGFRPAADVSCCRRIIVCSSAVCVGLLLLFAVAKRYTSKHTENGTSSLTELLIRSIHCAPKKNGKHQTGGCRSVKF